MVRHSNINPAYDVVAKKIFADEQVAREFISDMLDLPVKKIEFLGLSRKFTFDIEVESDFFLPIDVLAELENGARIIVEIQLGQEVFSLNRIWNLVGQQFDGKMVHLKKDCPKNKIDILPVYMIAMVGENCFDDNRPIHTFSLVDETSSERLNLFDNFGAQSNLLRLSFIELQKYNPDVEVAYNKKRWLELFANEEYTQEVDELIKKIEHILNMRDWSEGSIL